MLRLPRALIKVTAIIGFSCAAFAQIGPQLSIGPGRIYTVASRATNNLDPTVLITAVAFQAPGTVYFSDAHSEGSIKIANVYKLDLTSGQVTRVVGIAPDHINGNAAIGCTQTAPNICPGDGGPAISALLQDPEGLALDSAGNLYIAELRLSVIRKVNAATGIITTIAGTGISSFSGDGGPATQASLQFPIGMTVDAGGNLYIADSGNHRIRMISPAGQISTVAGTSRGFSGDNGPATSAALNTPTSVAVDNAGNLFIADWQNHAIRRVSSGIITTVAGQGGVAGYTGDGDPATAATLNSPRSVAADVGGNLYITELGNNVVRKVTGDVTHTISTLAGNPARPGYSGDGGPALSASLSTPSYVVTDAQANLFIVDNANTTIRRITSAAAPLTLPLTAVGNTGSSPFPLTFSNTGTANLAIASVTFPANFTAGLGTCPAGGFVLAPGQSCTLPVNITPVSGGSTSGTMAVTSNTGNGTNVVTNVTLTESNGLYFVPVTPCRVIDTRLPDPIFGGGAFKAQEKRDYAIRYSNTVGCASAPIPANANVQAYSLNFTVVPPGVLSYLTVYPSSTTRPVVSTLNSYDGRTKANAAIVPANLADTNRGISVYADGPTHVIADINGYYVPEASLPSTTNNQTPLAYYPLPPCRAVDTRPGSGLLGQGQPVRGGGIFPSNPPTTVANFSLTGVCSLPATAQAYALNYTAIPSNGTPVSYVTTWPTGTPLPVVSVLNATTGAVTANAAIVPAGTNGSVSVYSSSDTDLIIDVAGYYAPPGAGGLALYNVTPCRAFDSRDPGSSGLTGGVPASRNVMTGRDCNVPATAQSYVLNTTALPNGTLPYITAWASGSSQPLQSVLNAYDGAVTSNMAVVPTVDGTISLYAYSSTGLLLDLSAYFAQ